MREDVIEKETERICTFSNSEYRYKNCNALNECECFKLYTEYLLSSVAKKRESLETLIFQKKSSNSVKK